MRNFFMAKRYRVLSVLGLLERIMTGMNTAGLMSWVVQGRVSCCRRADPFGKIVTQCLIFLHF